MRSEQSGRRAASGYTLIEMLVVMGIILLMVALVLVSIGSMLRGTKMANTVNLFVSAADEARTAGITLRRAVQVDLTRLDSAGRMNRLTTIGAYICDNFEGNTLPSSATVPATNTFPINWTAIGAGTGITYQDGTYCLKLSQNSSCYNGTFGIQKFEQGSEDYESLLQARVKFKPTARTAAATWGMGMFGSAPTTGGGYGIFARIGVTANSPLNSSTTVLLTKSGTTVDSCYLDRYPPTAAGTALPCKTLIKEGVWYRIKLSIKYFTQITAAGAQQATARIAGKLWVDGQLEPPEWTVGPYDDTSSPLTAGFGGFSAESNDVLIDDVFFDLRAIRPLPKGLRVDMIYPEDDTLATPRWSKRDIVNQDGPSPFNFPIVFRPDGTSAKRYIVRLTDTSSGDKRYVVVEQNTGRTRPADSLDEAIGP